jgi:hypothetical protein
MVVVALVVAFVLLEGKRNARWHEYAEGLDELRPGMTEEEVRAVFPSSFAFEAESSDGFGSRTWVSDSEAVPARVLRVGPGARVEVEEGKEGEGGGDGAEVYFDEEGRLVGVRERAREGGFWSSAWGMLGDGVKSGSEGEETGESERVSEKRGHGETPKGEFRLFRFLR